MVARSLGGPGRRESLAALHPVGRLGNISEVVVAALFLLSDASPFTTGISLPVDGGWTAQ
jgi:NAD(P)-dependent dehydrogenase (short-subunit alcohol dehydrogenase family)